MDLDEIYIPRSRYGVEVQGVTLKEQVACGATELGIVTGWDHEEKVEQSGWEGSSVHVER
jgi:hypothetical protein